MPKITFSNFNGLSQTNRNEDGKFSVGNLIDPTRDLGYIKPALAGTAVAWTDQLGATIKDITRYSDTISYAIEAGKFHQINNGAINKTSPWPRTLSGIGNGISTVIYTHKANNILGSRAFYIGTAKAGVFDYDNSNGFDDDWLNTVPADAAVFSDSSGEHAYFIWQNMLFLGDGRYIVRYDGLTGNEGTYTAQWFDVGWQWKVKAFFRTEQHLGIIARGFYTDDISEIILVDGSSTTEAVRRIFIQEKVIAGINLGNELFFITQGIDNKCWIKQLGELGLEPVFEIKFENTATTGTFDTFSAPTRFSEVDIYDSKIAFACKVGTTPYVFVFGRNKPGDPYTLSKPFNVTGQTITAVKWIDTGTLYVASYTTTTEYLQKFTTGNATGTMKLPFKDFGQKIRINYIKFYFKPLVPGDNVTPTIDVDYGTSWTLNSPKKDSTISYALDEAITSKRFNVKRDCHAFRPAISWTAGGVAFSKITVDYDFISD